jgi:hypothetical protein
MKILKLIFLGLLLNKVCFSQNTWDTAWVNSYGGRALDLARDLKETRDKGFILAGSSTTFGGGNSSFYIIKTDSLGKHQWSKTIGRKNNNVAYSVEHAPSSGYYFCGYSNGDISSGYDAYVVRTDFMGNILWEKFYGGYDWQFIYGSCLMPDSGLVLCGSTYSATKGGSDAYIIRINANGDTLWTKKFGSTGDDVFYSVEQVNNRLFVVGKTHNALTGYINGVLFKLDFNGNNVSEDLFKGNGQEDVAYSDVCITSNGELLLSGRRTSNKQDHFVLRKIDSTAYNQIYYQTDNQNFYFKSAIEGYGSNVYGIGRNSDGSGGTSAYYSRFTTQLYYLFSANFGGSRDEDGYRIIKTSKGYAFVGSTKSYGNFNTDGDENVYLVIFNKQNLVNDYFIILKEFEDNLSQVGLDELKDENESHIWTRTDKDNAISFLFNNETLNEMTIECRIFDLTGKVVFKEINIVSNRQLKTAPTALTSGIYYYQLCGKGNILNSGKVAVE